MKINFKININILLLVIAVSSYFVPLKLIAADIIVGSALQDCDFDNIKDAINAAALPPFGFDTIKVARSYNKVGEFLVVNSKNLTIEGGYNSCLEARSPLFFPSGTTIIDGTDMISPHSTISFSTGLGSPRLSINLRNLLIRGGGDASVNGGGLNIKGNFDVHLQDSIIEDNQGRNGGGIYLDRQQDASLTILRSIISTNSADENGGGVYCEYPNDNSIDPGIQDHIKLVQSIVDHNIASQKGGGFMLNNCRMSSSSGASDGGIQFNLASQAGGGIAANYGSVILNGFNYPQGSEQVTPEPAYVGDNISGFLGGGIYLTNSTFLQATNARIFHNQSNLGAGLFASSGSAALIRGGFDYPFCQSRMDDCSSMQANVGTGASSKGAAVYAETGAAVIISDTIVSNNSANTGSAIYADGDTTFLSLSNNQITRNTQGDYVVEARNQSILSIMTTSFGGNEDMTSTISVSDSQFNMDWSVIYEGQAFPLVPYQLANISNADPVGCNGVNIVTQSAGDVFLDSDPFVNEANGNLNLIIDSSASDICPFDQSLNAPARDIHGERRYLDNRNIPGQTASLVDAGADAVMDNELTVGIDVDCDYRFPQQAVDALTALQTLGSDQTNIIRIQNTDFLGVNTVVDGIGIRFVGAYDSCANALLDPEPSDQYTSINGTANTAVFTFSGTPPNGNHSELSHIQVSNGLPGILARDSQVLIIKDSMVRNNQGSTMGAGLHLMTSTGAVATIWDTLFQHNTSTERGGAIDCDGHNPLFANDLTIHTSVMDQNSGAQGGGIRLDNNCQLEIEGTVLSDNQALRGGGNNGEGGAIYAGLGTEITGQTSFLSFSNNHASDDGGAVYNVGRIDLQGSIYFIGNSVLGGGLGDSIYNAETFILRSDALLGHPLFENSNGFGMIENVSFQDGLFFDGVHFKNNQVQSLVETFNAISVFSNCLFENNTSDKFFINEASQLVISSSTFASNILQGSGASVVHNLNALNTRLSNNIFWDDVEVSTGTFEAGSSLFGDCNIARLGRLNQIPNTLEENPQFVAPGNGDFHLSTFSPGIDLCAEPSGFNVPGASGKDMDGDDRGLDSSIPDVFGPFDVGYDEVVVVNSDVIFANSFE